MSSSQLLQDIKSQPESISQATAWQFGAGRPSLLDAARAIRGAHRLIITGMGASLYASIPLNYYLASHGIASVVIETSELLQYAPQLCRDCVLVIVSRSGDTIEVVKLLGMLDRREVTVVGVTNEPGSALACGAQRVILVQSLRDQIYAVQTYTAALTCLLLIGAAALDGPMDPLRRDIDDTIGALEGTLRELEGVSQTWIPFFDGASLLHLLGRGPSLASAMEGSLLINEIARFPTSAASVAAFRHGPVEIAGPQLRAIVFATQSATRKLDIDFARDLAKLGAMVRMIGPQENTAHVDGSWPVSRVSELFSPVLDVAPVQFAALRLAELRGVTLGQFRFATPITLAESGFDAPV
jgi:glucosamine--fructose-6-phosphate aminotransferase (isomerizing)